MRLKGKAFIGEGSRIVVGDYALLEFGDDFVNTAALSIICFKHITFGDRVLTSWDTLIMDTDFHCVIDVKHGQVFPEKKEIVIGDHCWIGCRCTILKGAKVNNDTVVAANSVVTRAFDEPGVLIAGNPAVVKKTGLSWGMNGNVVFMN
ncbi:MAG: acyltransferase [Prevotella sp.]|nr:acyltransferase [Prevotella sp.]